MGIDWRERAGELWTIPNLVSLARLPLLIVLVVLLESLWRYPLFALIVFTDALDGWLARRLDQTTELGAMLDPALDKLTALLLFFVLFPRTELAIEYLVLFFARDGFVIALGVLSPLLTIDAGDVQANTLGKVVTNVQFMTMVAMLVPQVPATQLLMWLLGVASVLAIADYLVFVGREMTATGLFESREAAAGVYVGTALVFLVVVRLLLFEELQETVELII
ncbi:CDP-alcohol phosphatidyltransferase family protein [Halovenus rubra]|uniref:CDP-alcohol phosphatidyltransferase family protein n=2 Tax=Halovenus rubra TaxID=869890 RepID=A0ABD5X441_9EURY|nr:CDP-alcohol phosphatidyltransferase family protein [Halovenus rubra]